jgi:hypothetical protein
MANNFALNGQLGEGHIEFSSLHALSGSAKADRPSLTCLFEFPQLAVDRASSNAGTASAMRGSNKLIYAPMPRRLRASAAVLAK